MRGNGPVGAAPGQLSPARLGHLAPALLGLPDPGDPLRDLRHRPGAGSATCRSRCRTTSTFDRPGNPLARHPTWKHVACPQCGGPARARDRHAGHLRRFVLVLRPLHRSVTRDGHRPAEARDALAAGRPVYRRHRARDPAPALRPLRHPRPEGDRPCRASTSRSPACSPRAWSRTRPIARERRMG